MVGATMWKEQELKVRFVRGMCRLAAFDDRFFSEPHTFFEENNVLSNL